MVKLLRIEWLKAKKNKGFISLIGLFVITQTLVLWGLDQFNVNLSGQENGASLDFSMLGILNFPKVWAYFSYMAGFFKIIPAVIIVTLMSNEFEFRTLRQHLIDGLSREEFVGAKALQVLLLALFSGVVLFPLVLIFGRSTEGVGVLENSQFLLAYVFQNLCYFSFAFLLALVIRKAALSVLILLVYGFILEPLAAYKFSEIAAFLPLESIGNLIQSPFKSIVGGEVQTVISLKSILISSLYLILFWLGSLRLLKTNDF